MENKEVEFWEKIFLENDDKYFQKVCCPKIRAVHYSESPRYIENLKSDIECKKGKKFFEGNFNKEIVERLNPKMKKGYNSRPFVKMYREEPIDNKPIDHQK